MTIESIAWFLASLGAYGTLISAALIFVSLPQEHKVFFKKIFNYSWVLIQVFGGLVLMGMLLILFFPGDFDLLTLF